MNNNLNLFYGIFILFLPFTLHHKGSSFDLKVEFFLNCFFVPSPLNIEFVHCFPIFFCL